MIDETTNNHEEAAPITIEPAGTAVAAALPEPSSEQVKKLVDEYAAALDRDDRPDELARAIGVPVETVDLMLQDVEIGQQLAAAVKLAETKGTLNLARAHRVIGKLLRVAEQAIDEGLVDADDVPRLLPVVGKIVEHTDRMKVAQGGDRDRLPVLHVHFGARGGMTARIEAPRAGPVRLVEEVPAANLIGIEPAELLQVIEQSPRAARVQLADVRPACLDSAEQGFAGGDL